MSEVLWEFVAPYMPLAPEREAVEKLLTLAIAAWNVTLFPVAERAQRLHELSTTLPAEARTDFLALEFIPINLQMHTGPSESCITA